MKEARKAKRLSALFCVEGGFDQAFSKACAVEAAEASSPSAEGETTKTAFLFDSFFFAPRVAKEKAAKSFFPFAQSEHFYTIESSAESRWLSAPLFY